MTAPAKLGFRAPAEWDPHESTLVAWPAAADLWLENLPEAQAGFTELCRAIADPDPHTGRARGERLEVLVTDAAAETAARAALDGLPARFLRIPYGDIWLRDTAPILLLDDHGTRASAVFAFNGWGEKYILPHDDRVASRVAEILGHKTLRSELILEGGSVEVDGCGALLTTEQCLLNPNRNPGRTRVELERELCDWFGADRVLWLGDGLLNDHTDGHIDTIARFIEPGVAVCMAPSGEDDPNREILETIARDLSRRGLEVTRVPSPGLVLDEEGEVMPASYVNYYLANTTVVVPQYGTPHDRPALEAIASLFPSRRAVGAPAKAILSGGGAFHCITQQVPLGGAR